MIDCIFRLSYLRNTGHEGTVEYRKLWEIFRWYREHLRIKKKNSTVNEQRGKESSIHQVYKVLEVLKLGAVNRKWWRDLMKAGKGSWFHAVERLFKEDKDNKTSLN